MLLESHNFFDANMGHSSFPWLLHHVEGDFLGSRKCQKPVPCSRMSRSRAFLDLVGGPPGLEAQREARPELSAQLLAALADLEAEGMLKAAGHPRKARKVSGNDVPANT